MDPDADATPRRFNRRAAVKWSGIAISCWLAIVLLIQVLAPNELIEQMPEECPADSQNCSRLSYDDTDFRMQGYDAMLFNATIEKVFESVLSWIDEQYLMDEYHTVNNSQQNGGLFIHAIQRTPILFFPDDLTIEVICVDGMAGVTAQSQSRLGIGDLGVNPERLDEFYEHMMHLDWSGSGCNE